MRISTIFSFIESKIGNLKFDSKLLRSKVYKFHSEIVATWRAACYKKGRFYDMHSSWLQWLVFSVDEPDIDNVRTILNAI